MATEAGEELAEAIAWYAKISPELCIRFADAVEETVEAIFDRPLIYAVIHKNYRRAGVKRFPYGIFFVAATDRIIVIACFHAKRNPERWMIRQIRTF